MSTRRKILAFAVASAAVLLVAAVPRALAQPAPAASAPAAPGVSAEIMVMHATQVARGGSIDPKIGSMPQLQKPPFSAYNTYTLVDKKTLPLTKGAPVAYEMVNGRTLQITLLDITGDKRFHIHADINQPGGKAFLKLLEVKAAANEPFFVGGQVYRNGTLVLGVTIKP